MLSLPRRSRRLLVCLATMGALALLSAGRASAGYGVAPNGQSYPVTLNAAGSIQSPASLDLVVYLDSQDSDAYVWVSESPAIGPAGTPVGAAVGSCSPSSLLPFGEANKWVCRVPTTLMTPGRTYHWWLDFRRSEPDDPTPRDSVSGPFTFSLAQPAPPPPPPPPPPAEEDPPADPHAGVSSKTVASAAVLPGAALFNGSRSVKHTKLTQIVYRTMKEFGLPRQLAFACWNRADWLSVLAAEGDEPTIGGSEILGFWLGRQPRWLHLAPGICADVQGLLTTRKANARRAGALATVIHETLHAYGVANEAQTNCWAVQLVPYFGLNLGLSGARADYLGTLARNHVRKYAPAGYWNSARCRDGGAWDLFTWRNLG